MRARHACELAVVLAFLPAPEALAQQAKSALPEVEVIQQKPAAAKKAVAKAAPKKTSPPPQQQQVPPAPIAEQAPPLENSPYGAAGDGAAARAAESFVSPVNPTTIVPADLQKFPASATTLTRQALTANQPRNINEALTRVPGVTVINDDGNGQQGGVAVRGSPARRSRKVLVQEDGHTVNLALWLDPSVHYFAPIDRLESIEVLRGTIISQGPNNNFGVVNVRNLSPFGSNETVISSSIGFTRNTTGEFRFEDENTGSEEARRGSSDTDLSARWHVHTRQEVDNVGIVLSYTGSNVQGTTDVERSTFHDIYGAIGWKGSSSDLVVSSVLARQRDTYDEQNFLAEFEAEAFTPGTPGGSSAEAAEEFAEQFEGGAERAFFNLKHCKTCFAPAAGLNSYNADVWRGQVVHNAYLDDDTTITSRLYAGYHRRDRYQLITPDSEPDNDLGDAPVQFSDADGIGGFFLGEDSQFGRLRTFRHVGAEVRGEWANRNILGFKQDLQAGIRYEYQNVTNRNILGVDGEILKDGDDVGATIFDRPTEASAVSAFLQSNVTVAKDFNVIPGIRFEWFDVSARNRVLAEEESEAEGADDADCVANGFGPGCLVIGGINFNPEEARESYSSFNALPGIAFAYTGFKGTTIFGGYNRGLTTAVLRAEDFPAPDEIGDNFNVGIRTSAFKGLELEVAGYYNLLHDYQFGASFSSAGGDRVFGRADEVEISGVELYGRLNSQPFTGGSFNVYGEANYAYSRGIFKDADQLDGDGTVIGNFNGNRIPEVPLHVAALTLGVEKTTGWRWDASVTWTYRGSFFTDEANTTFGAYEAGCDDNGDGTFDCEIEEAGENGEVPDIWLLSARINMDIGNSGASFFIAGDNLLDKLYITDREDGIKAGQGRTLWTGFKYQF